MKPIENATSLVVVGAWNPAILQPDWLVHKVFDVPEGEKTDVLMQFAPIPGAPPKFIIKDLIILPASDRLTIAPTKCDADGLNAAEAAAEKLLRILIHTPVVAFGQNFEFEEANPGQDLLNEFNLNDHMAEDVSFEYDTISTEVVSSLDVGDRVLNFSRMFHGGHVRFKFNFHYEVKTASEAADKLNGSFNSNNQVIGEILDSYNVVLEEPDQENMDAASNNQ